MISNSNGYYRLLTWQRLPAVLTIEHQQYEAAVVTITESAASHEIQLHLKQ